MPDTIPGRPDLGQYGAEYFADTSAHAADWFCFDCITATTFTVLTGNVASATGIAFPAGTKIFGRFTTFTLTSGSVIAYKAS